RGSALVVAVDHLAKRLERLVGAAGSERALSAAQHVVRCVFVAHLASVDDDGAGRSPAGGDQRGEEEDASHCITWTWASFGGSKRNRESGSPELAFASLHTSWFTSPCPLVSTQASSCQCLWTSNDSLGTSTL